MKSHTVLAIVAVALLACSVAAVEKEPNANGFLYVDPSTGTIKDRLGRDLIFHGVNAVAKNAPYHPITTGFNAWDTLSEQDFKNLQSWGQNIIRLGVMWAGVEPQPGVYNETYLNVIESIVKEAGKYGIYTLLDMHQDLLSEKFCGDGLPVWMITANESDGFARPFRLEEFNETTGLPLNCYPNPLGNWASYYLTFSVSRSFQRLYTDKEGWLKKWGDFWEHVAQRFRANEYVIGYELINEPWAGNIWKNLTLLAPGNAERELLQNAYDYLAGRIRYIDDRHIIFFEPVTWDNIFPTGFTQPPGGAQYANRSVFSYHYYTPPDLTAQTTIYSSWKDARTLNVGGMLTEFYISRNNDFPKESIAALKSCDRYQQGWIGWTYKPYFPPVPEATSTGCVYYPNGTAIPSIVANLSRTYPQAVAGKTIAFSFTPLSAQFYLDYLICLQCGSTDIYISEEYVYPNGYLVSVIPSEAVTWFKVGYVLRFQPTAQAVEGTQVSIVISAKRPPVPPPSK